MTQGRLFRTAAICWASWVVAFGCGGVTSGTPPAPVASLEDGPLSSGGGNGARDAASSGGRGPGGRVTGGAPPGRGGAPDASVRDASLEASPREGGTPHDGATLLDAAFAARDALSPDADPNDPCRPGLEPAALCDGDVLRSCYGGYRADTDCTTRFLDTTHPTVTTCVAYPDYPRCSARVGETCFTANEEEPFLLPCLGADSGCVVSWDDSSRCVEHLGVCGRPGDPPSHRCEGPYLYQLCSEGQPYVRDCREHSPTATCAEGDGAFFCENVAPGGSCDSDANGSTRIGWNEARCAPGLTCVGAELDGGWPRFGTCVEP